MSATDAFLLAPPTSDDLVAAKEAWIEGLRGPRRGGAPELALRRRYAARRAG
jgi:hypothetical protein